MSAIEWAWLRYPPDEAEQATAPPLGFIHGRQARFDDSFIVLQPRRLQGVSSHRTRIGVSDVAG